MPDRCTVDAALGGRLRLKQPSHGHRFGHDAMLLAAATDGHAGEHAVELGAGIGAAGLALAQRIEGLRVSLVEIDPTLAALAAENTQANGLSDRVSTVVLDAMASAKDFAGIGLPTGGAHHVLMNPPFNDEGKQQTSPDPARARAHAGGAGFLAAWAKTAHRLLARRGTLTLIWRADRLAEVLEALENFGGLAVKPVHGRADAPAIRVLVRAVKGSHAPLHLLPPLVLADKDGQPTTTAESILRDAAPLPLA